jgi:hypothetical protein
MHWQVHIVTNQHAGTEKYIMSGNKSRRASGRIALLSWSLLTCLLQAVAGFSTRCCFPVTLLSVPYFNLSFPVSLVPNLSNLLREEFWNRPRSRTPNFFQWFGSRDSWRTRVSSCFATSSGARGVDSDLNVISWRTDLNHLHPALLALYNAADNIFLSLLRAPTLAHQHAYLPVQSADTCHGRHTLRAYSTKQNNIARIDWCVCTYCIVCHLVLTAPAETTFEKICSENNITIPSKWTRRVELVSLSCCPYCEPC